MRTIVLIICFLMMSCSVSTSITSVYQRSTIIDRIIVSAPYDNLEDKQFVESIFVEKLRARGIVAQAAIDEFPPLRNHTSKEVLGVLKESNYALLVVSISAYWESNLQLTPDRIVGTSNSTTTISQSGSRSNGEYSGYVAPGISVSKMTGKLDCRLFIAGYDGNLENIWRSSSTSKGLRGLSPNLWSSAALAVIEKAQEDGAIGGQIKSEARTKDSKKSRPGWRLW